MLSCTVVYKENVELGPLRVCKTLKMAHYICVLHVALVVLPYLSGSKTFKRVSIATTSRTGKNISNMYKNDEKKNVARSDPRLRI